MQLTLFFIFRRLSIIEMPYMGFLGQKTATQYYFPSEKAMCFQLPSPRTRRRRCLVHQKIRPRINTTLLKQLTNNRTDLANAFVENKRHIYETFWAMGNVKTVRKEIKNFRFFD